MSTAQQQGPAEVLRAWLLALPRNAHEPELDLDTDIIETGILDSLEFVNFLMLIESLRAQEIQADDLSLDAFRSLRTIVATYLPESSEC